MSRRYAQSSKQGELYIVVDALDECPNFPGYPAPREQVLAILRELVILRLPHVHFCFTSRPKVDIRNVMKDLAVHNVSPPRDSKRNQLSTDDHGPTAGLMPDRCDQAEAPVAHKSALNLEVSRPSPSISQV